MLYVIRHGQVDTNIAHQVNGWNEESLNATGIKQAQAASIELQKVNFDVVFCSPLKRTRETLENLNLQNVPIYYEDRLKERNSNSMVYAPVISLDNSIWYDKSKSLIYKDTEGFKNIISRIESLLNELKKIYQNKNVLLVTHGDICKAIYLYFNPNTIDISTFRQENCEIVSYEL